jgi:hypothetical protein
MKKTIWSLENIKQTHEFYTEIKLLCIICSILLWKEHHKGPTILHCDSLTKKLFKHLDILHLWDKVYTDVIDSETKIDKQGFWASSKVRVLKSQVEPVRIIDNDFLAYSRIDNLDKGLVTFCHDEDGRYFYPSKGDKNIAKTSLSSKLRFCPDRRAANVSYLSFSDLELQREYASTSCKLMEELSTIAADTGTSKYMTFAEQKILKSMVYDRPHSTLITNSFNCEKGWFYVNDNINDIGKWSYNESRTKFWHVGFEKINIVNKQMYDFFYKILNRVPGLGQKVKEISA